MADSATKTDLRVTFDLYDALDITELKALAGESRRSVGEQAATLLTETLKRKRAARKAKERGRASTSSTNGSRVETAS